MLRKQQRRERQPKLNPDAGRIRSPPRRPPKQSCDSIAAILTMQYSDLNICRGAWLCGHSYSKGVVSMLHCARKFGFLSVRFEGRSASHFLRLPAFEENPLRASDSSTLGVSASTCAPVISVLFACLHLHLHRFVLVRNLSFNV
jgi:hypothetical protein